MTPRGLLVVIAGPSGVGKGTVHGRVRAALPDSVLSVSVTTRPARPNEADGVDYHFVDRPRFEQMVADGELLEWAEYAGNLYGTPRRPAEAAVADGKVVVLDIEVQGALQVREQSTDALLVFLAPPSFAELERRLRTRGTEDDEAVDARLEVARRELAQRDLFDAVVVNDDLDRCVAEVLDAIAAARTVT
ncbi:guanylate kinase [Egicoccus sp. AB-alg2]|uniref:guanylate kinase n=1 Tax=Egicoccus sp. AB-alg2 TaxID=3242693 RepID=UPI00359E93F7